MPKNRPFEDLRNIASSQLAAEEAQGSTAAEKRPPSQIPSIRALCETLQSKRENAVHFLAVDQIVIPSRYCRFSVRDDGFEALKASIREHGQAIPICVRPVPEKSGIYELVYGRRRLLALADLGLPVRTLIRNLTDVEAIIAVTIENFCRL